MSSNGLGLGVDFGGNSIFGGGDGAPAPTLFGYELVKVPVPQGQSNGYVQTVLVDGMDWTPKYVRAYTMPHRDNSNARMTTGICQGYTDGTRRYSSIAVAYDNDGTEGTGVMLNLNLSTSASNYPIRCYDTTNRGWGHIAFVPGGVEITWALAPSGIFDVVLEMFGGDDVQAEATALTIAAAPNPGATLTGLPFQPDMVFGNLTGSGSYPSWTVEYAAGLNSGILTKGGLFHTTGTFSSFSLPSVASQYVGTDAVGVPDNNPVAALYRAAITGITADGWSAQSTTLTVSRAFNGAALSFGGKNVYVGVFDMPTVTGSQVIANLGWTPKFVRILGSLATAAQTIQGNDNTVSGPYSITLAREGRAYCFGMACKQGQNPTNIRFSAYDDVMRLDDVDGVAKIAATFDPFAPDLSLNFSAVDATPRKFILMAAEA